MDLFRAYLSIQQERFGDRLNVEYRITADQDAPIPSLSIQPLVENAVSEGVIGRQIWCMSD